MIEDQNAGLWPYEMVEARLIEAMGVARRVPDRERGWMTLRAYWPDIVRERCLGDYDAYGYLGNSSDIAPARIPLNRAELARMQEAEGWLGRFLDEDARRLVVLAAGWMVSGRRVSWTRIGRIMGVKVGREAIKLRYLTAVAQIEAGLNGKGKAAVSASVRRQRMAEARRAMSDEASTQGRVRGQRRRRIEVDIIYSD